jgi:short-subunit dehydrogenase
MKTVIIIGASSGLGRELARLYAAHQYRVGITGRRTALLQELERENPPAYVTKTLDVTDPVRAVEQLEELVSELGGLDLLIISAGTGDLNPALAFELEHQTIVTNVLGFTAVADWAFHWFATQQFGHLVALSSIGGLRGSRHAPAYNASKAYQINYLEGLRQKARQLGLPLVVTDIRPGLVDTAMAQGEGLFWVMPVAKTAQQIYQAISSQKKVAYVTKRWGLLAFILKRIPRSLYEKM